MYITGQEILDEVAENLQHSQSYGGYVVALCPFHDDSRPSFFVYPDTYRCASCDAFGSTERLLDRISNRFRPQVERPKFRNPWFNWLKAVSITKCLKIAHQNIQERGSDYLKSRRVMPDAQKRFRLGILDGWITIPIFNKDHKVIGAVARATPTLNVQNKYTVPKGQDPNTLFVPSWALVEAQQTIYLTFGIFDAISLVLSGKAAISTTAGTRLNPFALDGLRKKIVIFPDKGEEVAAMKLASQLGWRGDVIRYDWPDDCKDPADLYTRNSLWI